MVPNEQDWINLLDFIILYIFNKDIKTISKTTKNNKHLYFLPVKATILKIQQTP